MPTPRPSRRASPAPAPIDEGTRAVASLLAAIERSPGGPAVGAYRAALARHGRNLLDAAGPAALDAVRTRIGALSPAQAEERLTLLDAAWTDLAAARTPGEAA